MPPPNGQRPVSIKPSRGLVPSEGRDGLIPIRLELAPSANSMPNRGSRSYDSPLSGSGSTPRLRSGLNPELDRGVRLVPLERDSLTAPSDSPDDRQRSRGAAAEPTFTLPQRYGAAYFVFVTFDSFHLADPQPFLRSVSSVSSSRVLGGMAC